MKTIVIEVENILKHQCPKCKAEDEFYKAKEIKLINDDERTSGTTYIYIMLECEECKTKWKIWIDIESTYQQEMVAQ